jgi:hypothetical protein
MPSRVPLLLLPCVLALSIACHDRDGGNTTPTQAPAPRHAQDCRLRYTDPTKKVEFFAFQDGSGPWTPVTVDNGVYAFKLTQDKGAMAVLRKEVASDRTELLVSYRSAGEMAKLKGDEGGHSLRVSGAVHGLRPDERFSIALNHAASESTQDGPGSWTMAEVTPGLNDLLAIQKGATGPRRMFVRRAIDIQPLATDARIDLGARGHIDFTGPEAAEVVSGFHFTPSGNPETGHVHQITEQFQTERGAVITLAEGRFEPQTPMAAPLPLHFAPPALRGTSDRHIVRLSTYRVNRSSQGRSVEFFTSTPAHVQLAPPPRMTVPGISQSTSSHAHYLRFRTQCSFDATYNAFSNLYRQGNRNWRVEVHASYGTGDIHFPDLTSVPGWNQAWALTPGTPTSVHVTATGQTWATGLPPEGARRFSASHEVLVTP